MTLEVKQKKRCDKCGGEHCSMLESGAIEFSAADRAASDLMRLEPNDGSTIDQLGSAISELFDLASIHDSQSAVVGSLLALKALEGRTVSLQRAGHIDQTTSNAVGHCIAEIRMALTLLL